MHWACYLGEELCAQPLLAHGADLEAVGEYGNRALHLACAGGRRGLVRALLQRGADPSVRNVYGNTPLCLASDLDVRALIKTACSFKTAEERAAAVAGEDDDGANVASASAQPTHATVMKVQPDRSSVAQIDTRPGMIKPTPANCA